MANRLFTSESVTEGHPDKVCDQISDAVLDDILAHDPQAHVACETFTTTGMVTVMGEISPPSSAARWSASATPTRPTALTTAPAR